MSTIICDHIVYDNKEILRRLDTASISDALDSMEIEGALAGLVPRVKGGRIFGPAFTVRYEPLANRKSGDFYNAGNYIDMVTPGAVVVISGGSETWTNWGDILSLAASRKGVVGTILDGSVRDIDEICRLEYPLFSRNIFTRSGKNRSRIAALQQDVEISNIVISPDDFIFADDSGVVRIPQRNLGEVIKRAISITETEERIRQAVSQGMNVSEARSLFRYDQPWLAITQNSVKR